MENKETRDKTAEHHKQKVSVIISSTNTTGNEKRDSILELMVEAIRLSKIEVLQQAIELLLLDKYPKSNISYENYYNKGLSDGIKNLTKQINELKNGK